MPAKPPATMRYVKAREPGPPDVLALDETATPVPKPGEVLIAVAYAGVNRPDCIQRAGLYPPPPDASPIIGLEVAGTIAALGDGVNDRRSRRRASPKTISRCGTIFSTVFTSRPAKRR